MLTWLSVDARTGQINADLTDIAPQGPIAVTMGAYTTMQFTIPLPKDVLAADLTLVNANTQAPFTALASLADFQVATRPGASVIIAVDELDNPIWGGLILQTTSTDQAAVTIQTATLEAYFDRRYIGAYSVTGRRQDLIVSDLINQFILDGTLPGLPIRVANTASATNRDRTYADSDDLTVYSGLSNLMAVQGGPQWTVGWERQHSPERITPVLYVADRLGSPVSAGLAPNAVFSMPGPVAQAQLVYDYTAGCGANRITAIGAGQGDTRTQATVVTSNYAGRPTFEYRWTPSTSIIDVATVTGHANAVLAVLNGGQRALSLTADIAESPVLGVDWVLGDSIGYDLMAPAWLDGSMLGGVATVGGWSRDDTFITPILVGQTLGSL